MKTLFKHIAFGALALMSASCLELNPKDQLADPDLWQKPGDFESFANKFYDWMPTFDQVYDNLHADKRSDLLMDKNAKNVFANGTNTVPEGDGDYTGAYSHIRRCNLLIQNAAKYPTESEIRQPLGEAYFFRAWNYSAT